MSAEPAPPFQTTIGGIADPRYSWEAANKAYVDALAGSGRKIIFSNSDSIGASGRRSLQTWIYGGQPRESAGGTPANTDYVAVETIAIVSVVWNWRGSILNDAPAPYMAIYDTDATAEILSTPVGVRDENHNFSPTSPAMIEAGKPYSLQFNSASNFLQNNIYRFSAIFNLASPTELEKNYDEWLRLQEKRIELLKRAPGETQEKNVLPSKAKSRKKKKDTK